MTANILFQANGGELPKTASDIGKPIAQDVPIGAEVANAFPIKAWDVTVEGYGVGRYYAASRGKALAEAWRCDAFSNISFGDFLKIASCWKAMFVPEGFGDAITVDGKPAFYVERNRAYVRAVEAGTSLIGNYHPSEVMPESYRPEQYRTTPPAQLANIGDVK